jgi:hypothetical protein
MSSDFVSQSAVPADRLFGATAAHWTKDTGRPQLRRRSGGLFASGCCLASYWVRATLSTLRMISWKASSSSAPVDASK